MTKHMIETTNNPTTALARAIGARNAVAENIEALRKTAERLEDAIFSAPGRIEAAKAEAAENRETRLQQVLAGDDVRILARRDDGVAAIERELEDLRGALAIAKAKISAEEVALDNAGRSVDILVGEVMRKEIEPLVTAGAKLQAELDAKRAALSFLQFALPPGDPLQRRVDALLLDERVVDISRHPEAARYRQWRLALMADASAEFQP